MTDYTSYKIEIIEGINDDPVPANFNNNGRGPNGSYFIQKYNAFLDAASATVDADETVKTSATDTTAGFLQDKLVAGDNITITLTAPGENESLTIAGAEPHAIKNGLSEAGFFTVDGLFEVTIAGATYARWDLGNPVGSTGCIAIGEDALLTPDVAAYNIAIGTECLRLTTEGTDNVALGSYALSANTTGWQNTAVGSYSLLLNTSGSDNVAIGCFSLWNNTVGVKNIALGDYALRDAVSASANVCVGHSTGLKTTGETNTYVGSECAMANTSGGANTALGYYALANSETGNWNVAVGRDAAFGTAGVSVGGLVAVGAQALKVTAASDNTAVGYQALTDTTTGVNNVAVGHTAASTLTTGSNVICIGQNAQPSATTVSNEITLGNASIASLRVPGLGFELGNCSAATDGQILTYDDVSGNWIPGTAASGGGTAVPPGYLQVYAAGDVIGLTSSNEWYGGIVELGYNASFESNVFFGHNSLKEAYNNIDGPLFTSVVNSVSIGRDCNTQPLADGYIANSVSIGYLAGTSYSMLNGCVFVGNTVGPQQTAEENGIWLQGSVVIGAGSATNATALDGSVIIGKSAANYLTDGLSWNTVAIGSSALQNTTSSADAVAIGSAAGQYTTSGTQNVFVGRWAGQRCTTGSYNVYVGPESGLYALGTTTNTTGSNNICIGRRAYLSAADVSNEITLGNTSITSLRCAVTSITSLSDVRDKKDIQTLPVGLDFVNTLNPVQFTWNTRDGAKVGQQAAGFIAQDLQEAQSGNEYLNLVLDNNPDRLEATPGNLIPVLVKAIQELAEKVEQQSLEIEALKAQVA